MTSETEQNLNLDDWTDFSGDWLRPEMIKKWPAKLVVLDVSGNKDEKGNVHLILHIDVPSKQFELNRTNQKKAIQLGLKSPKELIHKVLTFDKIRVTNPRTGQPTDSFELIGID